MLLEMLPAPWPDIMHNGTDRALSQWIVPDTENTAVWHIQVMNDLLAEAVAETLDRNRTFYCRHARRTLRVIGLEARETGFEQLAEECFARRDKDLLLRLQTPASHKKDNVFVNLPSAELIGRGICRRLSSFVPEFVLNDPETLEQILSVSRVGRYSLQSVTYQLEGHYIPAYQGWLEIHFFGTEEENSLGCALFSMAQMTGIGIKTALGMGGCTVRPADRKGVKK